MAKSHAQRQIDEINDGVSIPGVRLVKDGKPDEAVVVTLTAEESVPVVEAIKAVLAARG